MQLSCNNYQNNAYAAEDPKAAGAELIAVAEG